MDTNEIITAARDAMTVRRVFGDPQVQDGVTVIPAALVIGGMGAGSGQRGGDAGDSGDGGGFGVIVLPRGRIYDQRRTSALAPNRQRQPAGRRTHGGRGHLPARPLPLQFSAAAGGDAMRDVIAS
jgi:hypothetical protein